MLPLPIHVFVPSMMYEAVSRRAVVAKAIESDPCPGSVSANAPIFSSLAMGGSQRCFCSSDPHVVNAPGQWVRDL
jgi:hypothetical protein